VVDGHLPVDVLRQLRSDRPPIAGITLPGIDALARHVPQADAGLRHLCGHERWQGADGLRLGMTKARIANVLKTPVVNEKGPRRLRRK